MSINITSSRLVPSSKIGTQLSGWLIVYNILHDPLLLLWEKYDIFAEPDESHKNLKTKLDTLGITGDKIDVVDMES